MSLKLGENRTRQKINLITPTSKMFSNSNQVLKSGSRS